MNNKKLIVTMIVLSSLCFGLQGCGSRHYMEANSGSIILFLKNNIHTQQRSDKYSGSYANWTEPAFGHVIIPVNTVVGIEYVGDRYFFISDKNTGKKIEVEYNDKNMGMNIQEYLKLITAREPVSLRSFSDIDREGIADGKAYLGMSKEGVRVALGYPARHRTASLDSNTWIYWRGRFGTRAIDFDNLGKVERIR